MDSLERLSHMLAQPDVSEEDKNAAVDAYIMDGREDLEEIYNNMGYGLERLKTLRTLNIGRLANQNMVYAARAQGEKTAPCLIPACFHSFSENRRGNDYFIVTVKSRSHLSRGGSR